ncbi:hypothetical protein [Longimicrobium sp.]|jgi:hypothetical protein|uniref:hypothetical protein n=1 Tax=Longimicrobium sp. TaxID=2029185 RepID=UPI002ED78141
MKILRIAAAVLVCATTAATLSPAVHAQTTGTPHAQGTAVRVYLDCSGFYCDRDFFQTEIAFVTHVRDRGDAEVHVLITSQETGAGGSAYTLAFLGQGRYAGVNSTLTYNSEPNASEEARRSGLAGAIKLGLVRYAAETPQAANLRVTYTAPDSPKAAAPARDPWNHWTMQVSGRTFLNGEQTYSSRNLYGSLSASRITEQWKLRLSLNGSESETRFEIDSATVFTNAQSGRGLDVLAVRSLGAHVSAGITGSASRSTYYNQDMAVRIAPAIEYNLFPYSESTRRQLTARYSVGPAWYDYLERTVFERTEEGRVQQMLRVGAVARQPWGSIDVGAAAGSFLDNFAQNRFQLGGQVELNLMRGLSLDLSGSYNRLRDQIYLAAGEATDEEVLLRRRQLATGFQYFMTMGVSYTFGSRVSPVVNPRFSGGGAGWID